MENFKTPKNWAEIASQEFKCNVGLATEEETKQLTRSVLMSKAVRLQTEYMGTCRTKITIYSVPWPFQRTEWEPFYPNIS